MSTSGCRLLCIPHLLLGVILGGLLFLSPGMAHAEKSPEELYDTAINHLQFGTYKKAIKIFRELLYPSPGKLSDAQKRNEAHKLLGVAYYYAKQRRRARREFELYLYAYPRRKTIDPARYPPSMVSFFKRVRRRIKKKLDVLIRTQDKPKVSLQVVKLRFDRRVEHFNPLLCVVPFGVPYIVHNHWGKAAGFLASQVVFLGFNIAGYGVISSLQIVDPNSSQRGRFPEDVVGIAQAWQIVQFASLGLFASSYVYQLIDCALTVPRTRESVLPELPAVDPRKFSTPAPTFSTHTTQLYTTR